ncbi:DMT family transporter [Marinivivus vitaminiproducens]|uniref:DMT family transporter n=1 Tax=Marinivivus vitaminiproducens TaxID=3035935 RepID=UPI0027A6BB55|nr:DMT family transporter [Geminicoccaceae bacterium SCSIO 64248]
MHELVGVLAASASSSLGGTAIGATRYIAGAVDPVTLGALRFLQGTVLLLPLVLVGRAPWPPLRDWPRVIVLGLLFFALFPVLFNLALTMTTAARGALSLSTMPLLTMVAGALLGIERPSLRKVQGVALALGGVALAMTAGLDTAPPGAWRGDLVMIAAAACGALFNVFSRPAIARSGVLPFITMAMGAGGLCLAAIAWAAGGFGRLAHLDAPALAAVAYLGVVGSALIFWLWAVALARTTPTKVALSVTLNPVSAGIVGAFLLDEPLGLPLILGLAAILCGIALASRDRTETPMPAPNAAASSRRSAA